MRNVCARKQQSSLSDLRTLLSYMLSYIYISYDAASTHDKDFFSIHKTKLYMFVKKKTKTINKNKILYLKNNMKII